LKYIDDKGNIRHTPGIWTRFRAGISGLFGHADKIVECWMRGDFSAIPADGLNDHAPIYYVVHIWNHHIRS